MDRFEEKSKAEEAEEFFRQGYNCSQAVVAAFCDELNLDRDTALRLSSSFGGGMGRMREVCGAVSGMFMVAGMMYGYSDPKDQEEKASHYERIQQLAAKFRDMNGSIICRELLGIGEKKESAVPEIRSTQYYKKRPCAELVRIAAGIMEDYIKENENQLTKES